MTPTIDRRATCRQPICRADCTEAQSPRRTSALGRVAVAREGRKPRSRAVAWRQTRCERSLAPAIDSPAKRNVPRAGSLPYARDAGERPSLPGAAVMVADALACLKAWDRVGR